MHKKIFVCFIFFNAFISLLNLYFSFSLSLFLSHTLNTCWIYILAPVKLFSFVHCLWISSSRTFFTFFLFTIIIMIWTRHLDYILSTIRKQNKKEKNINEEDVILFIDVWMKVYFKWKYVCLWVVSIFRWFQLEDDNITIVLCASWAFFFFSLSKNGVLFNINYNLRINSIWIISRRWMTQMNDFVHSSRSSLLLSF